MDSVEGTPAAVEPAATGEPTLSPLTKRQHKRIAEAVDRAEELTGLQISVYLGPTREDSRAHAESMFSSLGFQGLPAVLILVAPDQHRLEIVTSPAAQERISDRHAALVATSMTSSFAVGDIVGGICLGVDMLARYAGPPPDDTHHDEAELPDVLLGYDRP